MEHVVVFTLVVHRFEARTTEAARLKIEVDAAKETIDRAELLLSKLEGEHGRWSEQVSQQTNVMEAVHRMWASCNHTLLDVGTSHRNIPHGSFPFVRYPQSQILLLHVVLIVASPL